MDFVNIGFVEESEPWKLHPKYFPSKVGGKPAWLHPEGIPSPREIACVKCDHPLIFLCQIYAPFEDIEDCFHRTLFIFICTSKKCCSPNSSNNLLVLRSQLPRVNDFYANEPYPCEENHIYNLDKWPKLCKICGSRGPSHCSKCKKVNYCSRQHQILDWQKEHKEKCQIEDIPNINYNFTIPSSAKNLLFDEFELDMDVESEEIKSDIQLESEMLKMQEILKKRPKELVNANEKELEQYASKKAEDKFFEKFKKRITSNPEQVLRYQRGGEPLWITDHSNLAITEIPNCEYCNGERQFEFQIMPQLLNHLNVGLEVDSIDWGVLCVFTCKNSCFDGSVYKKEYIIKQDLLEIDDKQ